MACPRIIKPTLPPQLLRELREGTLTANLPRQTRLTCSEAVGSQRRSRHTSRKDRRKAQRVAKGRWRASGPDRAQPRGGPATKRAKCGRVEALPKRKEEVRRGERIDSDEERDEDAEEASGDLGESGGLGEDEDGDDSVSEGDQPQRAGRVLPTTAMLELAREDAAIAALEKKLGLKGRTSLAHSFKKDGLDDLLGSLDGHSDASPHGGAKRKAEADAWLAAKRRKASVAKETAAEWDAGEGGDHDDGVNEDSNLFEDSEEDLDEESCAGRLLDADEDEREDENRKEEKENSEGFESEDELEQQVVPMKGARENPYAAPTEAGSVARYVPPSLRQEVGTNLQLDARLRRQIQGLVNRLTESSMVAVLNEIEKVYRDNARQTVTSILVDVLLVQVCDASSLPDTMLILTAGFATAVYRIVGTDFGAQLMQKVVERFGKHHKSAAEAALRRVHVTKETSNLITLLADMYNFQLAGPKIMFDYIRMLLGNLSELNAELLLRILRMCGRALRQDDPLALKDIVSRIGPAAASIGEHRVSVRTKFMIETMHDLKNNKTRAGAGASALVSEHTTRMKKLLGTLSSRKARCTGPLRMGLSEIQDSDHKGKWWLVGASWAGNSDMAEKSGGKVAKVVDDEDDDFFRDSDDGEPDLDELAREQRMNTDVRRSIFVAILSATDYEDAYRRLLRLRLSKDRQREIAKVVMQCAGAEEQYNPYYSLVAKKLCSDRNVRWSFQDSLWKLFRRMGESIFGHEVGDEDADESVDMRRIANTAKLFGTLLAAGSLSLQALKCLDLTGLQSRTGAFVEVMLITAMRECDGREEAVVKVFASARAVLELSRGVQWFVKRVVRHSDLARGEPDRKLIKDACRVAESCLRGT